MPTGVQARGPGKVFHQRPDVQRMKPVDIFVRPQGSQNPVLVHLRRQRRLDQNAVDLGPLVQAFDDSEQFAGGDAIRARDLFAIDPQLAAGLDFEANIDLRTRIVADQDHGQARRPMRGGELFDARFQL